MAGGGRDLTGGLVTTLAALAFGAIVTLGRSEALRDVPVSVLLSIRFAAAAAALAVILAIAGQSVRPARGEWGRLVLLGAIGYGVESAFFFLALTRGTAATVTLLFYTFPVWVAVVAAVLGMGSPGRLVLGALAVAVAGAGVVVASSGGLDISGLGIVFALASAVTISFFLIGLEALIRGTPSLASSLWIAAAASAAHASLTLASGTGRWPEWPEEWVPLLAMGVLTSGAFSLLFIGVRRLGAVRSSVIASLEPVFAAVLALLFLEELVRSGVVLGGALILAGAIAATLARPPAEPEEAVP